MARLRVEAGRSKGKSVEFEKTAIIGRGETAQLQISDLKASREHCKVFEQAGIWSVADLNSTNGITVNGVKTTRKTISPGDKIQIGETILVFELTPAAKAPGAADTADMPAVKPPAAADTGDMPASKARTAADTADLPAAKAPAARAAPQPAPSSATAKKQAAMAEARAASAQRPAAAAATKTAPAKAAGGGGDGDKGMKVSDHVLQYHKIDAKKAGIGDIDLDQSPALTKFLILVGCVGFIVLLLWLIWSFLGEKS